MARPKSEGLSDSIGHGRYVVVVRLGRRQIDQILWECRKIAEAHGWELDPHNARADVVEAVVQCMVDHHVLGPARSGVTPFADKITRRLRKRK